MPRNYIRKTKPKDKLEKADWTKPPKEIAKEFGVSIQYVYLRRAERINDTCSGRKSVFNHRKNY